MKSGTNTTTSPILYCFNSPTECDKHTLQENDHARSFSTCMASGIACRCPSKSLSHPPTPSFWMWQPLLGEAFARPTGQRRPFAKGNEERVQHRHVQGCPRPACLPRSNRNLCKHGGKWLCEAISHFCLSHPPTPTIACIMPAMRCLPHALSARAASRLCCAVVKPLSLVSWQPHAA